MTRHLVVVAVLAELTLLIATVGLAVLRDRERRRPGVLLDILPPEGATADLRCLDPPLPKPVRDFVSAVEATALWATLDRLRTLVAGRRPRRSLLGTGTTRASDQCPSPQRIARSAAPAVDSNRSTIRTARHAPAFALMSIRCMP